MTVCDLRLEQGIMLLSLSSGLYFDNNIIWSVKDSHTSVSEVMFSFAAYSYTGCFKKLYIGISNVTVWRDSYENVYTCHTVTFELVL
jgi:hypothetical protein